MSVLPDDDEEEFEPALTTPVVIVNARNNKWLRKRRILYVKFLLREIGDIVKLDAF